MSPNRPPLPSAAPATIASAPLPPRVRRIVRSLFDHMSMDVIQSLNAMLPEYEQALFKQAEQARNNNRQAEFFSNLRSFQRNRNDFVPHFIFALESELASLRTPPSNKPTHAQVAVEYRTLTLVEDAVMDEEIVLRDIARRHETRAAHTMLLLGQRFGVLGGAPAFDQERLPVGPQALCRMLQEAARTLELDLEERLLLYRTFDLKVMNNYDQWAETLNQFLSREGVLPGLVFMPRRTRPVETPPTQATRPPAKTQASDRPLTGWRGPSTPSAWALTDLQPPGGATTVTAPAGAPPSMPSTGGPPGGQNGEPNFEALQALLAARRHALSRFSGSAGARLGEAVEAASPTASASAAAAPALPSPPDMPRRLVPTPDVLNALETLQAGPPPIRVEGQPRRSLKDIQEVLLARARQQHGAQATLASQDADTFELLGMLYKEMGREVRGDAPASDLLVRLQVPLVQAALRDREFFLRPQHPARELLNAVAESGATWQSEDDLDPQLLHRLHQSVEFVCKHYHGDEAVFEQANQEVQRHLQAAACKAELAERRQVEAARGKERLEIAKHRANDTIETALSEQTPPRFVQALLNQAWADVLTLTLLRQGDQSDEWAEQLQTTLQIVAVTTTPDAPRDPALAGKIEKALSQVGYHEDEAQAIARQLSGSETNEDGASRTELTARLKARARLGEQNFVKRKPTQPRSPKEQERYDYLRSLPFGTWFEFTVNQQGDVQRQRLSWFSPVTGNALFVNQRGQRVGEHSLDGLARLMAQNQAQVVTEDKGRLIDRAWSATLRALRSLTGMSPSNEGAGA